MKKKIAMALLMCAIAAGVTAMLQPVEAKPIGGLNCSIVYCPAPDCPPGTKAVILPGDCCFSCIPFGGGGK